MEHFSNSFETSLAEAITAEATTLKVTSATGAPAPNFRILIESEICLVTAVGGTGSKEWTVTRAAEAVNGITKAVTHAKGVEIRHVVSAAWLSAIAGEPARAEGAEATLAATAPTAGQKNALAGANGTPGTGNEYLTKQSLGAAGAEGKALKADDTTEETRAKAAEATKVTGPASAVDGDLAVYDGTTGKLIKDSAVLLSSVVSSSVGEGAPAKGLALNRYYLQVEGSKHIAWWRGKGAGEEPEEVADLTGTPADGSISTPKFAAANIDGAVGTPSVRTLLTTLENDNLHAPTAAAVLTALNNAIQGLSVKPSAALATTEALPACTYANGAEGVGATLTANANGALQLDPTNGVEVGQHILVKNQATEAQNGLYIVTQVGTGSKPWILTRSVEMDVAAEFEGAFVFVEGGTTNGGSGWTFASKAAGFTVGTTAVKWTQFSGAGEITAGTGIEKNGNTLTLAIPNLAVLTAMLAAEAVTAAKIGAAAVTQPKVGALGLGSRFSVDGWGSGSNSFAPTAKVEYWLPVKVLHACKITGLTYQVGTTSNGKVIVALYNAAGERLAKSAAVEQSAAEAQQKVPFEASVTLAEPQIVWVSIIFESATGTCMGAFNLNPIKKATEAAFESPASIAPPEAPVQVKAPYLLTY